MKATPSFREPSFREKVATKSPLVVGIVSAVVYGSLSYLAHRYVTHVRHALPMAIFEGLLFAALMVLSVLWSRKKFNKVLQSKQGGQDALKLQRAVKQGQLPSDSALRKALPAYLTYKFKINRRLKIILPIEFGIFTILGLLLWIADHHIIWLLFTVSFLGTGIYAYVANNRERQKLAAMQAKLKPRSE